VVPHGGGVVGYVTLWPSGGTKPFVATLNDGQGLIANNAAIVAAGTPSGGVSVFNDGPATIDVIIDMNGFFTAPTDLSLNTAVGSGALLNNTVGTYNTASGYNALYTNVNGDLNTADGAYALYHNTGGGNTAIGYNALTVNTSGCGNTAVGSSALQQNTTGCYNTASGEFALINNSTGWDNAASGYQALYSTTGGSNTASGYNALWSNTTGVGNIAIGIVAGFDAPSGNNDSIYIGSQGSGSDNSGTIQIGTQAAETGGTIQIGSAQAGGTYIAGIYGATASGGTEVYINSNGQLGTVPPVSSGRFKEQITDMGDSSSKLFQLRPVNFFYKPGYDDGSHALQYGLIAEEVAKVYPEMVVYGNDGQVLTVKYQLLAPMLLNEVQKQAEQIHSLEDRLAALETLSSKIPATTPAGQ
jgi:hypothetical protein